MYKRLSVLLLLLFFMSIFSVGQPSRNAGLTPLEYFFIQGKRQTDSTDIKSTAQTLLQSVEAKQQPAVTAISKVLLAELVAQEKEAINNLSTHYFEEALANTSPESIPGFRAWVLSRFGFYLYSFNAYEMALPYFMDAERLMEQFPKNKTGYFLVGDSYMRNAFFQGILSNYSKSTDYLKTALVYTEQKSPDYGTQLFAIAMDYYRLRQTDSAAIYLQKTMAAAKAIQDEVRYAKALGELGRIANDRNNFEEAIRLLEEDIAISQKNKEDRNTAYAHLQLGNILLQRQQFAEAGSAYNAVVNYAVSKSFMKGFEYDALQGLLEIAIRNRNEKEELSIRRRMDKLKPELAKTAGEEAIQRAHLEVEKIRLTNRIALEKAAREKQAYVKTGFAVVSALLLLLAVMLIISHRRKLKARVAAYSQRVASLHLEKLRSEKELVEKENTLGAYKTYLSEKNQQIAALEKEMKRFNNSSSSYLEEESGELYRLLESHLMTEENWQQFKQAFIKERGAEYAELMEQFPGISESGLRILLLQKMGLNNNETAHILGVTLGAIKKSKQRLKKKYEEIQE